MKAWREPLSRRWSGLQPRERAGLKLAAAVAVLSALWALVLAPALHTLRHAPQQHLQLEAQLQRMHALGAQVAQLRNEARTPAPRWRDELREAVQNLGGADVSEVPGGLRVVLKGSRPEPLGRWLTELGPRWRVQVSEASLRRDEQGLWHGQLLLMVP